MGLVDDVMGALDGRGGSSNKVMGALGGLVEQAGGVEGIMRKLESAGLGDRLQSWIGTGANKPISPDEVKQALGEDEVARSARQAGVSEDEAAGGIAAALPQLIDKASPDGKLPDAGRLDDLLKGFLGK